MICAIFCSAFSPANLYSYILAVVDQKRPTMRRLSGIVCGIWLIAAQLWYYFQFRELFRGAAAPILQRLWH